MASEPCSVKRLLKKTSICFTRPRYPFTKVQHFLVPPGYETRHSSEEWRPDYVCALSHGGFQWTSTNISRKASTVSYSSLYLYELSLFDLPMPETKPTERSWVSKLCPGCIKTPIELPATGRKVTCEISILKEGRYRMSTPGDETLQKAYVWNTPESEFSTSPSWKIDGIKNNVPIRSRPKSALVQWNLELDDIFESAFHIEVFDTESNECIGEANFELISLFESSYGQITAPHYKNINLISNSDAAHSEDDFSDPGRVRIRVAVISENLIVDLLQIADEELMNTGLQIFHRMIQYSDVHQIFQTVDMTGVRASEVQHPLRRMLQPVNFYHLLGTLRVFEDQELPEDELKDIRIKLASRLGVIFQTGIVRFGPLFTATFEHFGEELQSLTDPAVYGEELAGLFLEIMKHVPRRARLEAFSCKNGEMIGNLIRMASPGNTEDVQVKAISNMIEFLRPGALPKYWRELFLDRIISNKIPEILSAQLNSWHPQLGEQSLHLFAILYRRDPSILTDNVLSELRVMEGNSFMGSTGRLIQSITFKAEFQLELMKLEYIRATCGENYIYHMSNIVSEDISEAHTPDGAYNNVDVVMRINGGVACDVTHVIVRAPVSTSRNALGGIAVFLSDNEPTDEEMEAFDLLKDAEYEELSAGFMYKKATESDDISEDEKSQTMNEKDVIMPDEKLKCCVYSSALTEDYTEFMLSSPVTARYVTVRLNPGATHRTYDCIEVGLISVVCYRNEEDVGVEEVDESGAREEKRRRTSSRRKHFELLGQVGGHLNLPGVGLSFETNDDSLFGMDNMRSLPS